MTENNMETINGTKEELDGRAVQLLSDAIKKVLQEKDRAILGIPGGRSVQGIFVLLREADINWAQVHVFMVDERLVPLDDDESNFKGAREAFLGQLIAEGALPEGNVHPFEYKEEAVDDGVQGYTELFQQYGNAFDVILLSAGEDGHVASLYPNHDSIGSDDAYFIRVYESPKPPPDRVSASRDLLLRATSAVLLFYGDGKKDALTTFQSPESNIESCPALISSRIPNSFVLTDIK